jgi:hypothetical protein
MVVGKMVICSVSIMASMLYRPARHDSNPTHGDENPVGRDFGRLFLLRAFSHLNWEKKWEHCKFSFPIPTPEKTETLVFLLGFRKKRAKRLERSTYSMASNGWKGQDDKTQQIHWLEEVGSPRCVRSYGHIMDTARCNRGQNES